MQLTATSDGRRLHADTERRIRQSGHGPWHFRLIHEYDHRLAMVSRGTIAHASLPLPEVEHRRPRDRSNMIAHARCCYHREADLVLCVKVERLRRTN